MSDKHWNTKPQGKYPKTHEECYAVGKQDFLDGYTQYWTPNLGPMTSDMKAVQRWMQGWMDQRDFLLDQWIEQAEEFQKEVAEELRDLATTEDD